MGNIKRFNGKDAVLSHVVYNLIKNKNDTEKSPNIIDDYDTAKKLFTVGCIFIRDKVREKQNQSYCQQQGMTFKIKGGKQGKKSEAYMMW